MSAETVVVAIEHLARAFQSIGVEPPSVIELESREHGMRLNSALWAMLKNSAVIAPKLYGVECGPNQCTVRGIVIRWPAKEKT